MALPDMPSTFTTRETLRIGGGYNAPEEGISPAGGLDIDGTGNLATNGDVTIDGDLSAANIAAGQWAPTCTNVANCDSFANQIGYYHRIGTWVVFSLYVAVTPTAASTATSFRFSLPIPSNFASTRQMHAAGAFRRATEYNAVFCDADTTNDEGIVQFVTAASTSTHAVHLTGFYAIIA